MVVNQHRGELERLNRVARDIGSSPSALTSDAEFNEQLQELEVESNNLKDYSYRFLNLTSQLLAVVQKLTLITLK